MNTAKQRKPGFYESGAVLVEAMVAILIFSMGILALAGLQASMVKNASDAKFRADASFIAQQRIGLIWSDAANAPNYIEANTDISALLPNGTRTTTQAIANPNEYQVIIRWQQPGEAQHSYTATADIVLNAGG